ncbi:MAG: fumarylacetoacetate hydrolase family protein, partial [Xanthobacteraceae bacterium]
IARSPLLDRCALAQLPEPPWYGPVCQVVWEGRSREAPPYPDHANNFPGVETARNKGRSGRKRVRGNHLTPVEAATGTPAGVGMPRGEFLKAGDEVQIEIANCGRLRNRMITECERE